MPNYELFRMAGHLESGDHQGMEPWVLIPVTAVFAVLFLLIRNERVRRRIFCPMKRVTAEIDVIQRHQEPEKPVRVKTCSLLPDPTRVDCGQDCIRLHS